MSRSKRTRLNQTDRRSGHRLPTSWASSRSVVSKIGGGLVAVALWLLIPGAASALPPLYRDFAPIRSGEVRCDQLTTVMVTHPRSLRPAKVGMSLGWRVGSSVTNDRAIPVAIITATEQVRDAKGDLGIQWTLRGTYEACAEPARQHFFEWSFGIRVKAKPRPPRVYCWDSYAGEYTFRERVKPRRCFFNGGAAHALQVPLRQMRWRSWGGRTACGRGEFFYNQGLPRPGKLLPLPAVRRWWRIRLHPNPGHSRARRCPRRRVWPRQADPLQHADRLISTARVGGHL